MIFIFMTGFKICVYFLGKSSLTLLEQERLLWDTIKGSCQVSVHRKGDIPAAAVWTVFLIIVIKLVLEQEKTIMNENNDSMCCVMSNV